MPFTSGLRGPSQASRPLGIPYSHLSFHLLPFSGEASVGMVVEGQGCYSLQDARDLSTIRSSTIMLSYLIPLLFFRVNALELPCV